MTINRGTQIVFTLCACHAYALRRMSQLSLPEGSRTNSVINIIALIGHSLLPPLLLIYYLTCRAQVISGSTSTLA